MNAIKKLKAFGRNLGDGFCKLSFMLPLPISFESRQAALAYAQKLGLKNASIAAIEALGPWTFFCIEGQSAHVIDASAFKAKRIDFTARSFEELTHFLQTKIEREVRIARILVPAEAGVIEPFKSLFEKESFSGEAGLEEASFLRTKTFSFTSTARLGEIVDLAPDLLWFSCEGFSAAKPTKELKALLKAMKDLKKCPSHLVKVVEGPMISQEIAAKAGFDIGFEAGWLPSEAMSAISDLLIKKMKI